MSLLRRGQIQHALQAIPISTNNSTDQHAPQTQTYAVQIPKVWFFFSESNFDGSLICFCYVPKLHTPPRSLVFPKI